MHNLNFLNRIFKVTSKVISWSIFQLNYLFTFQFSLKYKTKIRFSYNSPDPHTEVNPK